jgi:hypothetical protein
MDGVLNVEVLGRASDAALKTLRACPAPSVLTTQTAATKMSPLPSVLELAAAAPSGRERLLDLPCRFREPSTGLAVPHSAQNLFDALPLRSACCDEAGLTLLVGDLEWLATSPDVANLCRTPHTRGGNPAVGYCATSAPHFTATWQTHADPERADDHAKLRAQLFFRLIRSPVSPAERAECKEGIRLGQKLTPLLEEACAESRAIRYLGTSASEPMAIMEKLNLDSAPAELAESLAPVDVHDTSQKCLIRRLAWFDS